jgi:hypothetical protein
VRAKKEKKKQVFHYTRWHVWRRSADGRSRFSLFFFPSPPRDFYVTSSSRAGRTCFCVRMVCTSCADSLDVCPLITLPSFICLLLFFSFSSFVGCFSFPSSWHLPTCHETAGDDGLEWKTTTTTTTTIIYTPTLNNT